MRNDEQEQLAIKRTRIETSSESQAVSTVYIRCASIASRGELVNGFLFTHKDTLEISEWFEGTAATDKGDNNKNKNNEDGGQDADSEAQGTAPRAEAGTIIYRLRKEAPVEVVYVKTSRKPFFLIEWRHPTAAELDKRKTEGDNAASAPLSSSSPIALPVSDAASQKRRTEALLEMGTRGVTYKGNIVNIAGASAGTTVELERHKLELRDAQKVAEAAAVAALRKPCPPPAAAAVPSVTSFVPRAVSRRK